MYFLSEEEYYEDLADRISTPGDGMDHGMFCDCAGCDIQKEDWSEEKWQQYHKAKHMYPFSSSPSSPSSPSSLPPVESSDLDMI